MEPTLNPAILGTYPFTTPAGARMKVKVINHDHVKIDFDRPNRTQFNTHFHSKEEAPGLEIPSEAPYGFQKWLPLIMRSRKLPDSALQVVHLSQSLSQLLLDVANGSIPLRNFINRAYVEDVEEVLVPAFSGLKFPPEGLFARLDECSPKDGPRRPPGAKGGETNVNEIILRLATSARVRNALQRAVEAEPHTVDLFFMPFDPRMASSREYRVFCPPGGQTITGVSQYAWHQRWNMSQPLHREDECVAQVAEIMGGVETIHRQILEELRPGDEMDDKLLAQGFTFDVLFDEQCRSCELIELNTFGARSGCGSCLFHWVKDRALLYGDGTDAEFRVAA